MDANIKKKGTAERDEARGFTRKDENQRSEREKGDTS
jgi:hypothetical protein